MISIIIPVYNVEAYLNRCVESVVNQSYADLEIILVDDGSPDNCGAMCDTWAKKDQRIKVVHKTNGGLSDARNAGLEVATGEYVGFVDSDDWIEKDMYQDLLESIQKGDAELAVTGINRTYDNGYSRIQFAWDQPFIITGDKIIQAYLQQGTFSTAAWDKLYIKSLFDNRRFPVGKQFEDAPVIFDILCNIDRLAVVGKPQYNYFQRANSITGKKFSEHKLDHYFFSEEIRDRVRAEYPKYEKEADVFWGCKICEILYTLYESPNKEDFPEERKLLFQELDKVWMRCLRDSAVPGIMKVKIIIARFRGIPCYTLIKNARAVRK